MGLRDIGATLPPGFRFYPSDEELVCHYLLKKIANDQQATRFTLVEIDLHVCEPWQLPEEAKLNGTEWYFFSFRDRKYATGFRTNRATITGYWKATGKDRVILDPRTKEIVGMRKTLVFYQNRAPNGIKTGWIMHEFRMESPHMPPKEDWVLCRVFQKSKQGDNNVDHHYQQMFDYTTPNNGSSPPPLIASPTLSNTSHHHHHTNNLLCDCQQQQQQQPNSSFTLNNSSLIQKPMFVANNDPNYNNIVNPSSYLKIMKESSSSYSFSDLMNSTAKNDDAYGFLWDMDLEEGSIRLGGEDEEGGNVFDVPFPDEKQDEFGQDDCGGGLF